MSSQPFSEPLRHFLVGGSDSGVRGVHRVAGSFIPRFSLESHGRSPCVFSAEMSQCAETLALCRPNGSFLHSANDFFLQYQSLAIQSMLVRQLHRRLRPGRKANENASRIFKPLGRRRLRQKAVAGPPSRLGVPRIRIPINRYDHVRVPQLSPLVVAGNKGARNNISRQRGKN